MLHTMLARLAKEYVYERGKEFAGSEFGNFVRHDLAIEAKKRLIFLPYQIKVKASVGNSKWAAVPWLAFFDPLVTETATQGHYIVYLINAQTEEIFLSLNQGTTAVYNEFGEARGRDVLRRRAIDISDRVPEFAKQFSRDEIDLGSEASLPAGYAAGHAFGARYRADSINQQAFDSDLEKMLAAYEVLVDRGGTTPSDVIMEDAGTTNVMESRKYFLSKRIERARGVRKLVLTRRNPVCEGCGMDPELHLSYRGPVYKTPLDVHHSKPINELAEGESRRYKVPDDFLVLCPTCHRLIHKLDNPSDLDALKQQLNFSLAAKKH